MGTEWTTASAVRKPSISEEYSEDALWDSVRGGGNTKQQFTSQGDPG